MEAGKGASVIRALLLTGLLAIPASAAFGPAASQPSISTAGLGKLAINPSISDSLRPCPPTAAQSAADRARSADGGGLLHKLDEPSPADAYVAVFREVNGCQAPIVIGYDVGSER